MKWKLLTHVKKNYGKKFEPYLDGVHLREDAPEEVREADKELTKIAWDLDRMQ